MIMKLSVSSLSIKSDATLVTGIPAKTNYSDEEFKNMISDFPVIGKKLE